jgi:TRAP-type C4-dicarboxylate transport system substrate-binding protein
MLKKHAVLLALVLALVVVGAFAVACGGETTATTAAPTETTAAPTQTTAAPTETTGAPAAQAVVLKLQGAFPEGGAHYYYFKTFQQKVEEYSNGTLKVEWGAGPEAIPANELGEALKNDTIQLVFTPFTYLVSHWPAGQVVKLMNPAQTRANGGMAYLNELTEANLNAHFLGRASDGVQFVTTTNKEIKSLDDFKGLKLRASPAQQAFFTALGAGVVSMPLGEIYDAIERHVIDGAGGVLTDITDNSLQDVLKYLIQPGIYTSDSSVMCAMGTWNKLDDVQKEALSKAMADWEADSLKHNTEIAADVFKTIQAAGMKIIELQGADKDKWLKLANDVMWAEVQKADPAVAEKMKTFITQ